MNDKFSEYNNIDLMKFIMAIMVIGIHTAPYYDLDSTIIKSVYLAISQVAVPYFFISTGFLLGNAKFKTIVGKYNL